MSVLEKASELIDCLGHAGEPVSLAFVRSALDMPKSSTHRLLGELAGLGIVRRTEDGRYSLGPRLLYWGEAAAETFDLRAVAEPVDAAAAGRGRRERPPVPARQGHARVHRGRGGPPRAATVHPARVARSRCGRAPPASCCWHLRTTRPSGSRSAVRRPTRRLSQRARRQARGGARADPGSGLGHVGRGARERRRGGGHAGRRLARTGRRRAVHLGPHDAPRPGTHRGRTRATPAQRRRDQRAPPRRLKADAAAGPARQLRIAPAQAQPTACRRTRRTAPARSAGPRGSDG